MKSKLAAILVFLLCRLMVIAQFTPSCVPHNNLRGYWPLDATHQGNDSWANMPGIVYGATLTTDRFGTPNAAYYFNGLTDSIVTSYAGVLGTQARAVSFWAKTAGANPAAGMYAVTWGSNNQGERYGCSIDFPTGCTSAGGAFCSAVHPQLGSGTSDNKWHHYVFQFSGVSPNNTLGSVEIYQDAKLVGPTIPSTVPGSFSLMENTVLNTTNNGSNNVRFAKVNYAPNESLLQGALDDIGIWDRMLDTCEIKKLYNCQAKCSKEVNTTAVFIDAEEDILKIFPNPSAGIFYVKNISDMRFVVMDVFGKVVAQGQGGSIDLSAQPAGVYYCTMASFPPFKLVRME